MQLGHHEIGSERQLHPSSDLLPRHAHDSTRTPTPMRCCADPGAGGGQEAAVRRSSGGRRARPASSAPARSSSRSPARAPRPSRCRRRAPCPIASRPHPSTKNGWPAWRNTSSSSPAERNDSTTERTASSILDAEHVGERPLADHPSRPHPRPLLVGVGQREAQLAQPDLDVVGHVVGVATLPRPSLETTSARQGAVSRHPTSATSSPELKVRPRAGRPAGCAECQGGCRSAGPMCFLLLPNSIELVFVLTL